jgi:hypothetical protein
MLGEVIDTYKKGKIKVDIIDSYVHPDYIVYHGKRLDEQGCLHEDLSAEELYKRIVNNEPY